jgi:Inner membrane protein CreD
MSPGRRTVKLSRMTPTRLAAIVLIYLTATVAWFALGTSVVARSGEFDGRLSREVRLLWGGPQTQIAPTVSVERPRTLREQVQQVERGATVTREVTRTVAELSPVALESSRIDVGLELDHRKKGLLWYDTYAVRFSATYRVRNPDPTPRPLVATLTFPSDVVQFDNFVFRLNGVDAPRAEDFSKGATTRADVPAGGEATLELAYDSRGLDDWRYGFSSDGIAQVKDFVMTMTTNFRRIDFPAGTMSPSRSRPRPEGWELVWQFGNLVTGQRIGMDLPNRLNPGPLAARITYFAPVSLLFFVTVMVIMGVLRSESLHPMNYAFLSAAFFAFHLLLAYLVDHLDIHVSFAIASVTSILLVVSYLRVVAGSRFAFIRAGLAQLIFLVLFSYAFFFEGYTGLTVTVGAIVTLFVLMQLTARVDWAVLFARRTVGEV